MKAKIIRKLISQKEGVELDFKQTVPGPHKIAKTLAAFANTRGGILLIGVNDDRKIVGADPYEQRFLMEEAATHFCQPQIPLHFEVYDNDEGIVLLVKIPDSQDKPHMALGKDGQWKAYVRLNDKSVLASKKSIKLAESQQPVAKSSKPKRKMTTQEASLLAYLKKNERITLKQFAKLVNFSERRARRILTELTDMGVLRVYDFEKQDFYALV